MTHAKLLFGLLPLAALAQAPAEPPPLMHLNVLVFDSAGQPVGDLNAADFQVTDAGKPQRILYFHRKGAPKEAALPAGTLTNRTPVPPHATAILFDFLNNPSQNETLDAIRKVGRSLAQLDSGEGIYLYVLNYDGSMTPIHPIPDNPLVPAADDKTWVKDVEAQLAKAQRAKNLVRPGGQLQEEGTKKTYLAWETLAKGLGSFSGERNIVWVMKDVPSVATPKEHCNGIWLECALYIPHVCFVLDRTGVAVDPVSYGILNPDANRGMDEFAGLVSGRPFYGDDLRTVLSKLADDNAGGYVLGYDPGPQPGDEKFHLIKVSCERAGVKVRARQRYYPSVDSRQPAMRAQETLRAAAFSPFDDPQIGLRATTAPAPGGQKGVHVELRIDATDLAMREEGGAFTDHIAWWLVSYNASGPFGSPRGGDSTLRLTKEQLAGMKDGLPFPIDLPIEAATKKIRFIIFDYTTGAVGSLSIPVGAS